MKRSLIALGLVSALQIAPLAVAPLAHAAPTWTADLRVDGNRDGRVDLTGNTDEGVEESAAAIVLPNLDDDSRRCEGPQKISVVPFIKAPYTKAEKAKVAKKMSVLNAKQLKDNTRLNQCNDAADEVVNGATDALDLAPVDLLAMPTVPADATGTLSLDAAHARVFVATTSDATGWRVVGPDTKLTADQLKAGLRLGVEAKDIVRDAAKWDGSIGLTVTVTSSAGTSTDTVRLAVAPMLSHHHLQKAEELLTAVPPADSGKKDYVRFNAQLTKAAKEAGVPGGVREIPGGEVWQQDYVEPMYASMPTPTGVHAIRLLLRSHQDRDTSRQLYRLRGVDVGVIWMGTSKNWSSLNSMGNFETIPPFSANGRSYPAGRIVIGSRFGKKDKPSERVMTMLAGQGQVPGGLQEPLILDTGWLGVGHVDEFLSFVPADSERGWRLVVADPMAAIELLKKAKAAGLGAQPLIPRDKKYIKSVDFNLQGGPRGRLTMNRRAAAEIAANVERIKAATGITDAEIARVPVLYDAAYYPKTKKLDSFGAVVPGAINSPMINGVVAAPTQFTLKVNGHDLFGEAVEAAYAKIGMKVSWVDDYYTHHNGGGEVHCGTNVLRDDTIPWW